MYLLGGMCLFKYFLQLVVGIFILGVSTFIAWYEGSAIVEDTFEWEYSTPFTKMLNKDITNGHDISQLDYFVYAVKFQPVFPIIMMMSVLYLLSVTGYYLIKLRKSDWGIAFWGIIGLLMLIVSGFLYSSSIVGDSVIFWISILSGIIFISVSILLWSKNLKYKRTYNTSEM